MYSHFTCVYTFPALYFLQYFTHHFVLTTDKRDTGCCSDVEYQFVFFFPSPIVFEKLFAKRFLRKIYSSAAFLKLFCLWYLTTLKIKKELNFSWLLSPTPNPNPVRNFYLL